MRRTRKVVCLGDHCERRVERQRSHSQSTSQSSLPSRRDTRSEQASRRSSARDLWSRHAVVAIQARRKHWWRWPVAAQRDETVQSHAAPAKQSEAKPKWIFARDADTPVATPDRRGARIHRRGRSFCSQCSQCSLLLTSTCHSWLHARVLLPVSRVASGAREHARTHSLVSRSPATSAHRMPASATPCMKITTRSAPRCASNKM